MFDIGRIPCYLAASVGTSGRSLLVGLGVLGVIPIVQYFSSVDMKSGLKIFAKVYCQNHQYTKESSCQLSFTLKFTNLLIGHFDLSSELSFSSTPSTEMSLENIFVDNFFGSCLR